MHQYQPTIIETGFLFERLLTQFAFLRDEFKQSWIRFKNDPLTFSTTIARDAVHRVRMLLSSPNLVPAALTAVAAIVCVIAITLFVDRKTRRPGEDVISTPDQDLVMLDVSRPLDSTNKQSIGKDGPGRVGFRDKKGEGSGPTQELAHGGGGGGNHNPIPPKPESCHRLQRYSLLSQPRLH